MGPCTHWTWNKFEIWSSLDKVCSCLMASEALSCHRQFKGFSEHIQNRCSQPGWRTTSVKLLISRFQKVDLSLWLNNECYCFYMKFGTDNISVTISCCFMDTSYLKTVVQPFVIKRHKEHRSVRDKPPCLSWSEGDVAHSEALLMRYKRNVLEMYCRVPFCHCSEGEFLFSPRALLLLPCACHLLSPWMISDVDSYRASLPDTSTRYRI